MYNQELHGSKGLYLVEQYLDKVCGKNYLDDESLLNKICELKKKKNTRTKLPYSNTFLFSPVSPLTKTKFSLLCNRNNNSGNFTFSLFFFIYCFSFLSICIDGGGVGQCLHQIFQVIFSIIFLSFCSRSFLVLIFFFVFFVL